MRSELHEGPQNRLAQITENKSEKIHYYGLKNNLPNEWMAAVHDSGTATRCVNLKAEFIQADGWQNKETAKLVINQETGQTADDLLAEIAAYVALNKGFALTVKRNMGDTGKNGTNLPASVSVLPFETVRVGLEKGKYQVNMTYAKNTVDYKPRAAKWYPAYKKDESPAETQQIIADQMRPVKEGGFGGYVGNVMYVFEKGPGQNVYPIHPAYSGLEDIYSDASLSSFEFENLETAFLPSAMLFTHGEMDDISRGEDGLTNWERFQKNLRSFQGRGQRAKVLHIEYQTKESKPELLNFDIGDILDGLEKITIRLFHKICRHMGVPAVLVEPTDTALGNGGLLLNAIQLLQSTVNREQRMIQRTMEMIFPDNDWSTSTLNLISYLPPEVLSLLKKEQILKMYGIAEEEKETDVKPNAADATVEVSDPETLKAQAALRGSVGGVTALLSVQDSVTQKKTTFQSGLNILKIIFGFKDKQAADLLGEPETAEPVETKPLPVPEETKPPQTKAA